MSTLEVGGWVSSTNVNTTRVNMRGKLNYFLIGIQGPVYLVLLFPVLGASISTPPLPLDSGVLLSNRQFSSVLSRVSRTVVKTR